MLRAIFPDFPFRWKRSWPAEERRVLFDLCTLFERVGLNPKAILGYDDTDGCQGARVAKVAGLSWHRVSSC
jgi:hypothetical protein